MPKQVLSVGNCAADHAVLKQLIGRAFQAEVAQAHGSQDALAALRQGDFSLVLVNRQLDRDDSPGLEVIRHIKSDAQLASVPVMMITNFPEHQDVAVAAGAERGFGKADLDRKSTLATLGRFLAASSATA